MRGFFRVYGRNPERTHAGDFVLRSSLLHEPRRCLARFAQFARTIVVHVVFVGGVSVANSGEASLIRTVRVGRGIPGSKNEDQKGRIIGRRLGQG